MRYFVDATRRLVRTVDGMETFRYPWREVTSQEYEAFRAETAKNFSKKKLLALRQQPLDVNSITV